MECDAAEIEPNMAGAGPKLSDTALLTGAQFSKWTLRLVFVLLAARSMGPQKFGVYILLFTVTEFLAVASGAGYGDYLTRETAKDARLGWGLASQLIWLRIAISLPIAALAVGLLALLHYPHLVLFAAACMALTLLPRSVSEAVQGALRGAREYGAYLAIELVLGGSLLIGGVLILARHGGIGMAIEAEVAGAALAAAAAFVAWTTFKAPDSIRLDRRRLLKTSAVFNAYSLVGTLYDRFDVVLLSKLAGDYATAIYGVAYRALNVTQLVAYGGLYSLLPDLSRDVFSQTEQKRLEEALGLLLSVAFFQVLATMVFAGPAIHLLLGERYAESALALKILIWAAVPRYINYAFNIGLLAGRRERVFVATSLVSLAVNLGGNLLLIPRFGWRAAASLTLATEVVLLAQNAFWIRRLLGKIPLPYRVLRTSAAFLLLLAVFFAANRAGLLPLAVGTGCLLFFAVYLYRAGFLNQVGNVWSAARATAA